MINLELGKRIKELRLKFGVSQDELAETAQLSLRTIQRIENGETEPRGDSLKRLSRALHVNVEELTLPTLEKSIEPVLKADRNILLLLNFSILGFLIFPLLGIIFPWILWTVYKDKYSFVNQRGKQIMKNQAWWCSLLYVVHLYVFSLKFFHFLHLPEPQNQKFFVIVIATLYVFNTLSILIEIFKCFEFTLWQKFALNFKSLFIKKVSPL
jgi:transcriptional regulator with XRE-family HTH domain